MDDHEGRHGTCDRVWLSLELHHDFVIVSSVFVIQIDVVPKNLEVLSGRECVRIVKCLSHLRLQSRAC